MSIKNLLISISIFFLLLVFSVKIKELVFVFVSYAFYLNKTNYLFSIFFAIMFIKLGLRLLNILIDLSKMEINNNLDKNKKSELKKSVSNLQNNQRKVYLKNLNSNVQNNNSFFLVKKCKDVVVINKIFKRSIHKGANIIVKKRTSDIIINRTLKSDTIF